MLRTLLWSVVVLGLMVGLYTVIGRRTTAVIIAVSIAALLPCFLLPVPSGGSTATGGRTPRRSAEKTR
jgi:hypothetical protein